MPTSMSNGKNDAVLYIYKIYFGKDTTGIKLEKDNIYSHIYVHLQNKQNIIYSHECRM